MEQVLASGGHGGQPTGVPLRLTWSKPGTALKTCTDLIKISVKTSIQSVLKIVVVCIHFIQETVKLIFINFAGIINKAGVSRSFEFIACAKARDKKQMDVSIKQRWWSYSQSISLQDSIKLGVLASAPRLLWLSTKWLYGGLWSF